MISMPALLRRSLEWALVSVILLTPAWAQACSVCFSAREGTRSAFLITTIALSLLPLGLIGGVIFWLRRKARSLDHLDAQSRAQA